MSPHAGPSRPSAVMARKSKTKKVASAHYQKAHKVTEKQRIEQIERAVQDFEAPPHLEAFVDLPISDATKRGLKKASFITMTDIQAKSLPVSLKGKDVLGAARTGSGKTLAFLIPVLEILYRKKWGPQDGLGALIISPTRELAVQIFEVLRSIGGYHSFSAGLVIGGKNLKDESDRLSKMNILVATPGRLLQHMDQTVGFACDNLQILVLDEADRILDMGFSRTLSALLSHIPKTRQTLLFSATQTRSVSDLARLSLADPVYIGVQEAEHGGSTPKSLSQHYTVCELDRKLSILWSFVKAHLQTKTLVFFTSCKQVRFAFETFCKLHPGVPLLHLHGKQKQTTRLATYGKFAASKHAVLFATDIAARGLDFAKVDWVLQADAPEDADTYIHRVGRTARYDSDGKALLLLCPSEEEGMVRALDSKGIKLEKIKIKGSKTHSIDNQIQNLAFQDPEIKYLGQRAFVSYLRSVHLQRDKETFNVDELPIEKYAASLGLPGAPKVKFLSKEMARKKNASHAVASLLKTKKSEPQAHDKSDESADEDDAMHSSSEEEETIVDAKAPKPSGVRTKYDRMFERKNQNVLSAHYTKLVDHSADAAGAGPGDGSDEDDFITLKRADHDLASDDEGGGSGAAHDADFENLSKRKLKAGTSRRAMLKYKPSATKLVFDADGRPHELYEMGDADAFFADGAAGVRAAEQAHAREERGRLAEADVEDRAAARERKREKKRKRKDRERGQAEGDEDGAAALVSDAEDKGYVSPDFDLPTDDEDATPKPTKRRRADGKRATDVADVPGEGWEADEALALRMLQYRR